MDEIIKWIDANNEKPDDSINVLIYGILDPLWPVHPEVWLGYWDSSEECWRSDNGSEVGEVTYWAELPSGPEVPS